MRWITAFIIFGFAYAQADGIATPTSPNLPVARSAVPGDRLFQRARQNVFRLMFRERGVRSGAGHGSAFAVRKDGYLVTNFHVVASAVESPERYEMVLEKDGGFLPAHIVTVDVVNDLALVKVDTRFEAPLQLKADAPSIPGEAAYSFGFPHSEALSLAQGNLNGERMMGFGSVLTGTMPINPGMSGGPCLDSFGDVVGVNRAIQTNSQNISYFSPWGALHTLVDHAGQFHPTVGNGWRAYAVDQIERQEKKSLKVAIEVDKDPMGSMQKFGHLRFHAPFDSECGQSAVDHDGLSKQSVFVCRGMSLSLLGENRAALNVTTFASASDAGLLGNFTSMASGALIANQYQQIKLKNYPKFSREPASEKLEICNSKNVSNAHGLQVTVRYCSLALKEFSGLYATALRIENKNKKGQIVSFGQIYEGMTMPATLELMQYFIESIEEAAP